jgi:hypothetical protein
MLARDKLPCLFSPSIIRKRKKYIKNNIIILVYQANYKSSVAAAEKRRNFFKWTQLNLDEVKHRNLVSIECSMGVSSHFGCYASGAKTGAPQSSWSKGISETNLKC